MIKWFKKLSLKKEKKEDDIDIAGNNKHTRTSSDMSISSNSSAISLSTPRLDSTTERRSDSFPSTKTGRLPLNYIKEKGEDKAKTTTAYANNRKKGVIIQTNNIQSLTSINAPPPLNHQTISNQTNNLNTPPPLKHQTVSNQSNNPNNPFQKQTKYNSLIINNHGSKTFISRLNQYNLGTLGIGGGNDVVFDNIQLPPLANLINKTPLQNGIRIER